ncbi:MAG: DUF5693 family protein, partial [Spirochaetes bacterium]|nr:DUF5693 family protein [Spirochaetota bacterium]
LIIFHYKKNIYSPKYNINFNYKNINDYEKIINSKNFFIIKNNDYFFLFTNYQNLNQINNTNNINTLYETFIKLEKKIINFYENNYIKDSYKNGYENKSLENNILNKLDIIDNNIINKNKSNNIFIKLNEYRDYLIYGTNIKIHFIPTNLIKKENKTKNEIFYLIKRNIIEKNINLIVIKDQENIIFDTIKEIENNKAINLIYQLNIYFSNYNKFYSIYSNYKSSFINNKIEFFNKKILHSNYKFSINFILFLINLISILYILLYFFLIYKLLFKYSFDKNINNKKYKFKYTFYLFLLLSSILLISYLIKSILNSLINYYFYIVLILLKNKNINFFAYINILLSSNTFNNVYLIYFFYFLLFFLQFIYNNNLFCKNYLTVYLVIFFSFIILYIFDKNLFDIKILYNFKIFLEKKLFIRPRLKELISFPFLIIYINKFLLNNRNNNKKEYLIKLFLYLESLLYFISIFNSFSHLFSSFIASIVRIVNGMILGILLYFIIYFKIKIFSLINSFRINFLKEKYLLKNELKIKNKTYKNNKLNIFVIVSKTPNLGDNFYRYFYKKYFSNNIYKILFLSNLSNLKIKILRKKLLSINLPLISIFQSLIYKISLLISTVIKITKCEEVHFIGGIWQDKTSISSFLFYFFSLVFSKITLKKIKFISVSIEKPKYNISKTILSYFPFIDYIWVRDFYSYCYLKNCSRKIFLLEDLYDFFLKNKMKDKILICNKIENINKKRIIIIFNSIYLTNIERIINNLFFLKNELQWEIIFVIVELKDLSIIRKFLHKNKKLFYKKNKNKIKIINFFKNLKNKYSFYNLFEPLCNLLNKNINKHTIIISYRLHASILIKNIIKYKLDKLNYNPEFNTYLLDEKSINYFTISKLLRKIIEE